MQAILRVLLGSSPECSVLTYVFLVCLPVCDVTSSRQLSAPWAGMTPLLSFSSILVSSIRKTTFLWIRFMLNVKKSLWLLPRPSQPISESSKVRFKKTKKAAFDYAKLNGSDLSVKVWQRFFFSTLLYDPSDSFIHGVWVPDFLPLNIFSFYLY